MSPLENHLIVNNSDRNFYQELENSLHRCSGFQWTVAFINFSGLQLLLDTLQRLEDLEVPGRIITSTYLNFTEPRALRRLKKFSNISLRVFEVNRNIGFHTKGYLFERPDETRIIIGSSNLTQSALKTNKEWNVRVSSHGSEPFRDRVQAEFDGLWASSREVDSQFLDSYELFYDRLKKERSEPEVFEIKVDVEPNVMQQSALMNFERLRQKDQTKALAIAATGSGKTVMAALDVRSVNPKRVLFIVHREQILKGAKMAFTKVIPERAHEMGMLTGNVKEVDKNFIFSTNLTIKNYLSHYPEDYFDYIVIDEAHHAASETWQAAMQHFKPKFLLGMTATPERTDGGDIFKMFDNNVAVEVRLRNALEEDLVVPFHYFGISDETADLHDVDLKDIDEIARRLKVNQRVDFIIEKMRFYSHDGPKRKAIGFCVNQDHAAFMAREFNSRGIDSVALNSNNSIAERTAAVSRLEDDDDCLQVIFTVDIFNEGVDIPTINTVLMLRPTGSPIVFIQQLGRGLRKTKTKEFLTVIDFIGNHAKTYLIAMALCGARAYDKDSLKRAVESGFADIPGCTNIRIDEIARERILAQIDETNFNTLKFLKEEYFEFKTTNHNQIPTMVDYQKFDGAPNPIKYINHSYSYAEFVAKVDESDELYSELVTCPDFVKAIRQLSNELPIKRPHEFAILERMLNSASITLDEAGEASAKYLDAVDRSAVEHSLRYLAGEFDDSREKEDKLALVTRNGNRWESGQILESLFDQESKRQVLEDVIRYGLLRYEEEFGSHDYGLPFFKLYQTYNGRNMALVSNYDKTHSAFRGSGLLQFNSERLLIIDLHKDESIDERINYKDKFINRSVFQWQSPNNTTVESTRGQELTRNKSLGINLHLFVRKMKKVDGVIQPFIYIGKGNCIHHEGAKPITIQLELENQVPQQLYDELTL